jgi:hypothetical protein
MTGEEAIVQQEPDAVDPTMQSIDIISELQGRVY